MDTNETIATNLLLDLHAFNKLDDIVVQIISNRLGVNAKEICHTLGITYNINS